MPLAKRESRVAAVNSHAGAVPTAVHLLLTGDPDTVARCLAVHREGDDIVAIDSGVLALVEPESLKLLSGRAMFSLVDVGLRGLQSVAEGLGASCLDDAELIERILTHEHSLSWK